jgi:3-isopropylmalate/(R)-2-methylmalate dehydratase small subunit
MAKNDTIHLTGRAHKYGSNINTDEIIPARYLNTSDAAELAQHCMEDLDKDFMKKIGRGDFIIAEHNFGCGSSREHAPIAIKAAGISAVIACSFARIFFRNAINIGLPILESAEAVARIRQGDALEVDLAKGEIRNVTRQETYIAQPFPPFMQHIIRSGGLIEYIKERAQ